MNARAPILALKDVRLKDGPVMLFDGVDLALEPRIRASLVGRNGAGKSTLMRILTGKVEPDAGDRFATPGIRISVVAQEPELTGATLLDYASSGGAERHEAEAQLQAFGYSSFVQGPGPTLQSIYNAAGTNDPGTRSPLSPYILTQARRTNLGNDKLDGYDFKVDYVRDTDWGTFSGGFSGTVSLQNSTQGDYALAWTSIQATNVPLYQVSFNVGYSAGPLTTRVTMNYSPSYQLSPTSSSRTLFGQTRISSFSPVNLNIGYDLTGITSWTEGADFSLTINNIADVHPPIVLSGGTANGSTIGRYIQVGLRKKF